MTKTQPSLTLSLLQAREAAMAFFRPLLNQHDLTEQQWRVIRILKQHGELENYQLAELACILKPSMTGVLGRLERDAGAAAEGRAGPATGVRQPDRKRGGVLCLDEGSMEANYQKIQAQFGEEKLQQLMGLLNDLKRIAP